MAPPRQNRSVTYVEKITQSGKPKYLSINPASHAIFKANNIKKVIAIPTATLGFNIFLNE
jgi:hypothetical protein